MARLKNVEAPQVEEQEQEQSGDDQRGSGRVKVYSRDAKWLVCPLNREDYDNRSYPLMKRLASIMQSIEASPSELATLVTDELPNWIANEPQPTPVNKLAAQVEKLTPEQRAEMLKLLGVAS